MESRLERTVFLFTLILMLGAFAAGQFAGSADITGFASSTDAWNYEGAETAGDYLEVTFDSLGDGAVDFIVSFIAIMAAFTLAGSTLMKAGGAFGESTEAKAAINLFGVAAALGGSIYYAEAVTTYVLVFIPLILVTVFYKFLKGLKDGEEAGYWNFVFGGMSLIVLGYFVVNSSKIGLDWAGYLSIFIGALVFIYGLMKVVDKLMKKIRGTTGAGNDVPGVGGANVPTTLQNAETVVQNAENVENAVNTENANVDNATANAENEIDAGIAALPTNPTAAKEHFRRSKAFLSSAAKHARNAGGLLRRAYGGLRGLLSRVTRRDRPAVAATEQGVMQQSGEQMEIIKGLGLNEAELDKLLSKIDRESPEQAQAQAKKVATDIEGTKRRVRRVRQEGQLKLGKLAWLRNWFGQKLNRVNADEVLKKRMRYGERVAIAKIIYDLKEINASFIAISSKATRDAKANKAEGKIDESEKKIKFVEWVNFARKYFDGLAEARALEEIPQPRNKQEIIKLYRIAAKTVVHSREAITGINTARAYIKYKPWKGNYSSALNVLLEKVEATEKYAADVERILKRDYAISEDEANVA